MKTVGPLGIRPVGGVSALVRGRRWPAAVEGPLPRLSAARNSQEGDASLPLRGRPGRNRRLRRWRPSQPVSRKSKGQLYPSLADSGEVTERATLAANGGLTRTRLTSDTGPVAACAGHPGGDFLPRGARATGSIRPVSPSGSRGSTGTSTLCCGLRCSRLYSTCGR